MDWRRFIPKYWMQNYPTNCEWDAILNTMIDEVESGKRTIKLERNSAFLGAFEVWAENWPYAYARPMNPRFGVMPTVATRKRLRKLIQRKRMDEIRKSAQ